MSSYLAGVVARYLVHENMAARGADPNVPRPVVNLLFILPTLLLSCRYGALFAINTYLYVHNSRAQSVKINSVDDMPGAAQVLSVVPCVLLALLVGFFLANELMYAIPYVRRVNEEYAMKANSGESYLRTRSFLLQALRVGPLILIPIFICAVLFL